MAVIRFFTFASAALLFAQLDSASAITYLGETDSDSLKWLGANSPYFPGPNVNGISNDVPENCYVEQVAYVVRHGSRYPDNGAYNQWVALHDKIQAAHFTSSGSLAFLKSWKPVLTNPTAQIAQESVTGYKEAYNLGYTLRTRYPDLYAYGTPFMSWANLYPRVVQTAQNFVRGFLGSSASSLGVVMTVNSTGSPEALFDSLGPSDQCPLFADGNGGQPQIDWNALYLPPILARLNTMISGNLNFTTSDVSIMPYLCGFESQITGRLSPWCSVFTASELRQYEYSQDLRYYYGIGPGTNLQSKMMMPFANSLVGLLAQGPGVKGTFANGSSYVLPDIITAFLNDGQLVELGAATGVWDNTVNLTGSAIPANYKYIASHFTSMRATVAFERLNCIAPHASRVKARNEQNGGHSPCRPRPEVNTSKHLTTSTHISTSTYAITKCNAHDQDCYTGKKTTTVLTSKTTYAAPTSAPSTNTRKSTSGTPTSSFTPQTTTQATAMSSHTGSPSTSSPPSSTTIPTPPVSGGSNQTYIRILLNDAVYPVPSCQTGPGKSCLMNEYVSFMQARLDAVGDLKTRCNVTNPAAPKVLKGASFLTDLTSSWIASVAP